MSEIISISEGDDLTLHPKTVSNIRLCTKENTLNMSLFVVFSKYQNVRR